MHCTTPSYNAIQHPPKMVEMVLQQLLSVVRVLLAYFVLLIYLTPAPLSQISHERTSAVVVAVTHETMHANTSLVQLYGVYCTLIYPHNVSG